MARELKRRRTRLARTSLLAVVSLAIGVGGVMGGATAMSRRHTQRYCSFRSAVFTGHSSFLNINQQLLDRGGKDLQCTLGRMAAEHIGSVRMELSWAATEQTPRRYHFELYDKVMTALAEHHISWLPVVEAAPPFRARHLRRGAVGIPPPRSPRQFAAFLRILVRRYGPHGSFWSAHRRLHYDPVRAWQVWNEPSLDVYWAPRSKPAEYVQLLHWSAVAIRSVDPRATVVAAGMPSLAGIAFYRRMYKLGARRWFDAVAYHPYSSRVAYAEQDLIMLRRLMNRSGDVHKPLWLTEFGWASAGPPSPFRGGADTPHRVSKLLQFMLTHRRFLKLQRLYYYDWRDPPTRPFNFWGVNMGLYRADGTPRPIARVIVSAARRLNG